MRKPLVLVCGVAAVLIAGGVAATTAGADAAPDVPGVPVLDLPGVPDLPQLPDAGGPADPAAPDAVAPTHAQAAQNHAQQHDTAPDNPPAAAHDDNPPAPGAAIQDGKAQDGKAQDGKAQDGRAQDGRAQNGRAQNSTARDTPVRQKPSALLAASQQDVTPGSVSTSPSAPVQQQVLALVNDNRRRGGCDDLSLDRRLIEAAYGHAADMARHDYFAHESPDGEGSGDRMTDAGYRWSRYGENIARGQQSAYEVVDGWMHSPVHRENIMDCRLEQMGIGLAFAGDGTPYWVQDFATAQ